MTAKRILLLITNLGKGGAQRVFYDHALAFSEAYSVEEVVFERDQDERIYDSGLPLHDLRRNDLLSKLGPIGRLLSRALALRHLVATGRFDMVISHMDGANWVNVLSGSRARKLLVVHGTVLRDQNTSAIRQWFRLNLIFPLLYNRADQTVAVSAGIASELGEECGVRNVSTIQNFFEIEAIRQKAQLALDASFSKAFKRPGVLVTSGRLSEQKKQTNLIDIVATLLKRGVSTRLVILGDGELRADLVRKCLDLKLRTFQVWDQAMVCHEDYDVYFLGYVANPYQYLAHSTLFLFPSGWEGFPLALCEAMISGVPVLSSDCPTGPREILAPGTIRKSYDLRQAEIAQNGVLLPMLQYPDDLRVWTDTVQKLLDDPALRGHLATQGAKAIQSLDRSAVLPQWHQLVEAVCDGA